MRVLSDARATVGVSVNSSAQLSNLSHSAHRIASAVIQTLALIPSPAFWTFAERHAVGELEDRAFREVVHGERLLT